MVPHTLPQRANALESSLTLSIATRKHLALADWQHTPDNFETPQFWGHLMRKFLLTFLILPTLSFASGTLQVKPGYFMKAQKVGGQLGLSIYENVAGGIHFSQWLGIGTQPRFMDDSVFYAVSETAFGTWWGNTGLALGYKFQHADKAADLGLISEHSAFVKVSRKLW